MFVKVDYSRKKVPSFFNKGERAFLIKKICFQQLLRSIRNCLISSTKCVRIPCGPLKIVSSVLNFSLVLKKNKTKTFLMGKLNFFLKKKNFSIDFLGPKEMDYNSQSDCQNAFWTFVKSSSKLALLNITRKKAKLFCHWEDGLF